MNLHDTHDWLEKQVDDQVVPYCRRCRVEGYEDEPAAFTPCPKSKVACPAKMQSLDTPGHVHFCIGNHHNSDHFCRDCRRWFG